MKFKLSIVAFIFTTSFIASSQTPGGSGAAGGGAGASGTSVSPLPLPGRGVAPINPWQVTPNPKANNNPNNNQPGQNQSQGNTLGQNTTGGNGTNGSLNAGSGTNNQLGISSNQFVFQTNLLGVFSNQVNVFSNTQIPGSDFITTGVGLGGFGSNATGAFAPASGNPLIGRRTNGVSGQNTSQNPIQDLAATPVDQAIVARIRQVVQPQNNRLPASLTPVHLSAQNGVVTLMGYVPTAEEKRRISTLSQRIPGVTRVVDQLSVATAALTGSAGNGNPFLPNLLPGSTNITPTGNVTNPFTRALPNGIGTNKVTTNATAPSTSATTDSGLAAPTSSP